METLTTPNQMTQEQVNRILAVELDGWVFLKGDVGNSINDVYIKPNELTKLLEDFEYTTDWNDFHRVWMKCILSDIEIPKDCIREMLDLITTYDIPLPAATRLAQIITDADIH